MKKRTLQKAIRASFCIILLIVVVLIILGLQFIVQNSRKENDFQDTEEMLATETESLTEEDSLGTEEMLPLEPETETETETQVVLSNQQIDNVEGLDNTCQNWGMGPSRDDRNRPVDAVSMQEKYESYSADFIKQTEENIIYLTFDEGYEYGYSGQILDTLKEKGVHAVFFVTKPYAVDSPELVQRMIDEGHIVGNHTVTHPSAGVPSLSLEGQYNEVMETDAYVKENFGYSMYLFRFPAGKFSDQTLAVVNNCNYRSVFWSAAYVDWDVENQPDPAEALETLMGKLHPGAIYLLHAESQTNAEILGTFIDQVRAAGYEIGVYSDTLREM